MHVPSGAFLQQRWLTTHSYASHLGLCSLLCLDHVRAYKATAADKLREATGQLKLGDFSFQVQKSQLIQGATILMSPWDQLPSQCQQSLLMFPSAVPAQPPQLLPGGILCVSSRVTWTVRLASSIPRTLILGLLTRGNPVATCSSSWFCPAGTAAGIRSPTPPASRYVCGAGQVSPLCVPIIKVTDSATRREHPNDFSAAKDLT